MITGKFKELHRFPALGASLIEVLPNQPAFTINAYASWHIRGSENIFNTLVKNIERGMYGLKCLDQRDSLDRGPMFLVPTADVEPTVNEWGEVSP